ncbi:hypothetical protein [Roseomonas xinghualingensis]|uniref:hypothetical protein n=1 Tax=Roseomonas xinghualingensis TaxID=2986475 RepID=UPI0021F0EACB|nr:hypothetical protein [Roseomonas sp. SXEYE001]MCV4210017.1 hypothetical protein [Roseomonas sp. SXEYE001]
MGLPRLLRVSLVILAASASGPALASGAAETCSTSTLTSSGYASARWCGHPPGPGTLRMNRRGGGAEEFLDVPIDTYREVIRTPNVARFLTEEVQPRFRQVERTSRAPAAAHGIRTAQVPNPVAPSRNVQPRVVAPVRAAAVISQGKAPQAQPLRLPARAASPRPAAPPAHAAKPPVRAVRQMAANCAPVPAARGAARPAQTSGVPAGKRACRS